MWSSTRKSRSDSTCCPRSWQASGSTSLLTSSSNTYPMRSGTASEGKCQRSAHLGKQHGTKTPIPGTKRSSERAPLIQAWTADAGCFPRQLYRVRHALHQFFVILWAGSMPDRKLVSYIKEL